MSMIQGGSQITAAAAGLSVLSVYTDIPGLTNYWGGVLAAKRSYLSKNTDVVERFLRAYYKSTVT